MVKLNFSSQLTNFGWKSSKRALHVTVEKVRGDEYNKWKVWRKFASALNVGTSAAIISFSYFSLNIDQERRLEDGVIQKTRTSWEKWRSKNDIPCNSLHAQWRKEIWRAEEWWWSELICSGLYICASSFVVC